jgi:hypothetical protein
MSLRRRNFEDMLCRSFDSLGCKIGEPVRMRQYTTDPAEQHRLPERQGSTDPSRRRPTLAGRLSCAGRSTCGNSHEARHSYGTRRTCRRRKTLRQPPGWSTNAPKSCPGTRTRGMVASPKGRTLHRGMGGPYPQGHRESSGMPRFALFTPARLFQLLQSGTTPASPQLVHTSNFPSVTRSITRLPTAGRLRIGWRRWCQVRSTERPQRRSMSRFG